MTPDIHRLHDQRTRLQEVLDDLEFTFIDDPRSPEPSDTSYLNDTDRADPDIMANVEAMNATNTWIAWFGHDYVGFVGLWQGPGRTPLERAPVVRLDTEGQYRLVAATVPDYIVVSVMDDDAFDAVRTALLGVGFEVAPSREQAWAELDGLDDPNAARHALYNQGRLRRGLPPI